MRDKRMKLIRADYIIGIAFVLMLGTHCITHYLIATNISHEELAITAKQLTTLVEQNPIAALVLPFKKLSMTYSFVLVPSLVLGNYYYIRKKYIKRDETVIEVFGIVLVLVFLINFFNDVTYLLVSLV